MNKLLKAIFSRATFMVIMVLLEFTILYSILHWFGSMFVWIDGVLRIYGMLVILYIFNRSVHLSFDLLWILLIACFPVPASLIYFLIYADLFSSRIYKSLKKETDESYHHYPQNEDVLNEMISNDPDKAGQFRYIAHSAKFPFYKNEGFDYYGLGDTGYPVMLEELRKAEKFIFLEYFIIENGKMWSGIEEILIEKAKQGVDVRVMYDDLGSFTTVSASFAKQLEQHGIKCIPFNRINPIIGIIMNHRDHRKITVIDGKVAFSGGVNLADEYINAIVKYGHWKDNIIRITGKAVWSYTIMFLTHWNALSKTKDRYEDFKVEAESKETDGYVAPYCETPLDEEIVAQNIYMNILNQANDYCYIYTPYLIIDTEFINALTLAAKRGVDVKLITPGIPDKAIIWKTTRSYYNILIEGGVHIYEYTPGFVHAKVFISDDKIATVGTINLDYRSLYHHFENGTYLYNSKKILDIKQDYLDTLEKCHEIRHGDIKMDLLLSFFKLFASLL